MHNPSTAPASETGACSLPGFLPAAMSVAGFWSTGTDPSSLGITKAGPRSGRGRETELFKGLQRSAGMTIERNGALTPLTASEEQK